MSKHRNQDAAFKARMALEAVRRERPVGAVLFEPDGDWQTSSRSRPLEAFAPIDKEEIDPILSMTTNPA